ncbi:hypothetical protein B2G52_03315 [Neisseria lactamica]|uniref:Uncharacterized protein n=1 Tax=Neisseria lactamica TaxID=486 RepID=A0AAU8VD53_NEILA|nr:hypothetical protein B2G52_03315 [Neisseria lactamica]
MGKNRNRTDRIPACAGMTKSNLSASFPRKRESRNPKLQEFIRNNRNLKNRIPACAGMTGLWFLFLRE